MGIFDIFKSNKKKNLKVLHFYMPSAVTDDEINRLNMNPPSVPVEHIHIEEREDLSTKYNIRCWPTLILVDEDGNLIKEFRGQIGGSKIDEYIKEHNL